MDTIKSSHQRPCSCCSFVDPIGVLVIAGRGCDVCRTSSCHVRQHPAAESYNSVTSQWLSLSDSSHLTITMA